LQDNAAGGGNSAPAGLFGANDLEPVVRRRYPAVDAAIEHPGPLRTGEDDRFGLGVFAVLPSEAQRRKRLVDCRRAGRAGQSRALPSIRWRSGEG